MLILSMTNSEHISWSDHWLVGLKKLDEDHQDFVRIIQSMQDANMDELASLLEKFETIASSHFDYENKLMIETEFPPRICHIDEHNAVLKSVSEVRALISLGENKIVNSLVKELAKWFPGHVIHLDSALSHWISKKQLGGKPVVIKRSLNLHHGKSA